MTKKTRNTKFRYVGRRRVVVEDRRFVAGEGRFAADVKLPDMLHIAVLGSPYPAARIAQIDIGQARLMPGVEDVVTGVDLEDATAPLMGGLDTPKVRRWPLAPSKTRYAGEWVAAVAADSRARAEDALEEIEIDYEPLDFVIDPETAFEPASPPVHEDHGSNVLLHKKFVWGEVDRHFADAQHKLSYRVRWHRNATVPIETFSVVARWDGWQEVLDVWASIQMPKFADQLARALRLAPNQIRVHYDIDVGGSYGVKRGLKHTVLAALIARRTGRPARLIEDRLENMTGGDAHGPDRIFDVDLAYQSDGVISSIKIRALDNVGAHAGRAPFQLGKPIGAITGPYMIESAAYEVISVTTNITPQEAVRGFGQSPTNYAIERGVDLVADALGMDRLELRAKNLIPAEKFPYLIPSGTRYDSGDYHKVLDKLMTAAGGWDGLLERRDKLRQDGWLSGLGLSCCLEPSGGNSAFEALLNPANDTTTWMESCQVNVDASGSVTVVISTSSSGQGHETLASTAVGEILDIDPDKIAVVRANSRSALVGNSPVGSRMAVMLGGAAAKAAEAIRDKLLTLAAHDFGVKEADVAWRGAGVEHKHKNQRLDWDALVDICHKYAHKLAPGQQPGLSAIYTLQVPTGGDLPDQDDRVQMYPCFSFEAHLVLLKMDPILCRPEFVSYYVGHDCGTVITPDIVRGMILGGIAHGIGAALMERFEFDEHGQPLAVTFMDYPMPSAHEVPHVEIIRHETPSPHTVFGQKGAGESGYLGAPAAIASAINDALAPLGARIDEMPMRMAEIAERAAGGRAKT